MARTGTQLLRSSIDDGATTLELTFFNAGEADAADCTRAGPGLFSGRSGSSSGKPQLTHPDFFLIDDRGRGRRSSRDRHTRVYPSAQGRQELTSVHQRRPRCSSTSCRDVPDPLPREIRARRRAARHRPRRCARSTARTRTRTGRRPGAGSGSRRRSSCRSRSPSGGPPTVLVTATPRRPATGGLLEAFDARLPFALTAGPAARSARRSPPTWPATSRCTGCCRARSGPARRSWRCGRCSPSSTPAARPRCSRRPRCSPPSTTARSRRCSATLAAARACSAAPRAAPGSRC